MDDLSPRVNHSYTSSTARTNASSVPEPCLRSYAITQTRGFFSNAFQTSPSLLSSFSVFKPSSTERIRILLQPPDIHLVNVQANTEGVSDLMRILQNFETKLPDVLTLIHSGQGINQVDQQGKCVLMYAVDTWLRLHVAQVSRWQEIFEEQTKAYTEIVIELICRINNLQALQYQGKDFITILLGKIETNLSPPMLDEILIFTISQKGLKVEGKHILSALQGLMLAYDNLEKAIVFDSEDAEIFQDIYTKILNVTSFLFVWQGYSSLSDFETSDDVQNLLKQNSDIKNLHSNIHKSAHQLLRNNLAEAMQLNRNELFEPFLKKRSNNVMKALCWREIGW